MKYEVILKPAAVRDLDRIRKYDAVKILDAIDRHLVGEPRKESKSRIRRLRGKQPADYRLRVGDFRIFYAVEETAIHILRVMRKRETNSYYKEV